jgi:hypothetical protein
MADDKMRERMAAPLERGIGPKRAQTGRDGRRRGRRRGGGGVLRQQLGLYPGAL